LVLNRVSPKFQIPDRKRHRRTCCTDWEG
jgi:hypothetical protein